VNNKEAGLNSNNKRTLRKCS